jgi:4-carboxymuconolactone decarboxylase
MARVSLIEEDSHLELAELIDKIKRGRRGSLINVYKLLLHSPPLAEAWLGLVDAVRWKTQVTGRLREMVIIRIGHLNRTEYVVNQHVPLLAIPEGLTPAECDALADWRASGLFDERERAALAYADAMTRDIEVSDESFAALRRHFDERAVVELTVMIGTYNMHTRVLKALRIDPEPRRS